MIARLSRLRASGMLSQLQYTFELEALMDNGATAAVCSGGSSSKEVRHQDVDDESDSGLVEEDGTPFAHRQGQPAFGVREQEQDNDAWSSWGESEPLRDFDTHDAGSSQDLMPSRGFAAGSTLVHASKGIVRVIRMGEGADYFNCERVYVRGTRLKKGCVPHYVCTRGNVAGAWRPVVLLVGLWCGHGCWWVLCALRRGRWAWRGLVEKLCSAWSWPCACAKISG